MPLKRIRQCYNHFIALKSEVDKLDTDKPVISTISLNNLKAKLAN